MPTFKTVVLKHQIKSDNTVRIKIRVTHNRESKYIDTGLTATTDDLAKVPKKKSVKLKTQSFIDDTLETIIGYRKLCNQSPRRIEQMSCAQLIAYLTKPEQSLDFISFADSHIQAMQEAGRKRSSEDYQTAINTLKRFINSDSLPVTDITVKFLQDFAVWIVKNPIERNREKKITMSRAPSHYLGSIRTLHNEMKLQYNDEDSGTIIIPGSPFSRFKVPKPPTTEKRAITAEAIKAIYNLPDKKYKRGSGSVRYNLAKDCFMLSFLLMGMNSADLYDCSDLKKDRLTYYRKKTRGRRADKAKIVVFVQPEVKDLIQKYVDTSGKRVFNFYHHYSDESTFNAAINKGLKSIEKGLEFYAARHSWATIGLNKAGVDKYLIHEALNHVDEKMKITETYLEKDWSLINDANRKVIDFVMKQKSPNATTGFNDENERNNKLTRKLATKIMKK